MSTPVGCFAPLRSLFSGSKRHTRKKAKREDSRTCYDQSKSDKKDATTLTRKLCGPERSVDIRTDIPCVITAEDSIWRLDQGFDGGDEPPPYAGPSGSSNGMKDFSIFRPEVMKTIEETMDALNEELRELSLKLHDHPEVAFEERYAHDLLTDYMRTKGFAVTPHYAELETAWRAEWEYGGGDSKTGRRTLGVNAEMDALPGIGHGCGHNLIAVAGMGIALSAKAAMMKHGIPGKIVLLGTPAEESGGGKVLLLERGAYEGMDLCLMCHPSAGPIYTVATAPTLATQPITVEYMGHPAHAAASPWEGQNALDAAVLAYNNVALLRQQIKPDCRVHAIIEGRDWVPNIIPDYARMRWIVRAPTYEEMRALVARVKACIVAAAEAASCRIEMSFGLALYDLNQNSVLANEFQKTVCERYGMETHTPESVNSASTDFGNVTYALPSLHPSFAIPTVPNGGNHTVEFAKSARTRKAHDAAMHVARGLALVGVRALVDDNFYREVKGAFEAT